MNIRVESAEQAFHEILNELDFSGNISAPRGHEIREKINVCVEIKNPRDRIVSCTERRFSLSYAFGELAWYLQGDNTLEFMEYYSKFLARGTDDGVTLNSAYGYRIFRGEHPSIGFNQWENVKRILREDPDSRQAIIHLHTPNNKKTNDEVCTLSLQFFIREGKLDMITTMRSNDLVLGFVYDVFCFTMLQEILSNELNVELGTYYHNVGSMHVYQGGYYGKRIGEVNSATMTNVSFLGEMESFNWSLNDFKNNMCKIEEYMRRKTKELISGDMRKEEVRQEIEYIVMAQVESLRKRHKRNEVTELEMMYIAGYLMRMTMKTKCSYLDNFIINELAIMNEKVADIALLASIKNKKEGRKIIVEGPDCAGKTTYIREVLLKKGCSHEEWNVRHFGKPTKVFDYFSNYIHHLVIKDNEILDRFFISEIIYAEVFKRRSNLNGLEISRLNRTILQNESIEFVFIVAKNEEEVEVLKKRAREKGESKEVIEAMSELNENYLKVAHALEAAGVKVEIESIE